MESRAGEVFSSLLHDPTRSVAPASQPASYFRFTTEVLNARCLMPLSHFPSATSRFTYPFAGSIARPMCCAVACVISAPSSRIIAE